MNNDPLSTRPPNQAERKLREKFVEDMAGQGDLMDKLAQQLITLELAIPGLYATVLKLTQGDDATLDVDRWLIGAFGCWFVALLLTLLSLIPRRWKVDPTKYKPDPVNPSDILSLEEYFFKRAQYKRRLLLLAVLIFFAGVVCAVMAVF